MRFDNVSTLTNTTHFIPVPSHVAQVSQANSQGTTAVNSTTANPAGITNLPFGGRAAHRG